MDEYDYYAIRELAHELFPKVFVGRQSMPVPLAHGSRDILIEAMRLDVPASFVARFYGAWTARPEYALAIAVGLERFLPCGSAEQMISEQARETARKAAATFYGTNLAKKCATAADVYAKSDSFPEQARATILNNPSMLDAICATAFSEIEKREREGKPFISPSARRKLRRKRAMEAAQNQSPQVVYA